MKRGWGCGWLLVLSGCTFGSSSAGGSVGIGGSSGEDPPPTTSETGMPAVDSTAGDGDGDGDGDGTSTGGGDVDPSTSTGAAQETDTGDSTGAVPTCGGDNGGCDLNATCDDTSGAIVCTCNPGWQGDGATCVSSGVLPTVRVDAMCVGTSTGCFGAYCVTDVTFEEDMAVMEGDPGVTYNVTIHLRGALSEATIGGGSTDGFWNEGGAPIPGDLWGNVQLSVSDPAQSYYVNAGFSDNPYCTAIDYTRNIPVATGATVTLTYDDGNQCAARNEDSSGAPISFPRIDMGSAFNGQILQVDMVDSVPAQ